MEGWMGFDRALPQKKFRRPACNRRMSGPFSRRREAFSCFFALVPAGSGALLS
jgi:hypothetical protein